ncbi:MAG: Tpl protein [Candidatus Syntrophosphaera sp.]|jgi:cell fate regulator YaaT (PSP1 superfamily)|nr:Tpl protein [Candidatus Syntrophosphaera sp.]
MVEPLDLNEEISPEYLEVIFRTGRLGYYQNNSHLPLKPDDLIIVEVDRGEDIAQVIHLSVTDEEVLAQIPQTPNPFKIKRIATEEDIEKLHHLPEEEEKAAQIFGEILKRYSFDMKLIDTVYQFDGNKITFFFTAEGRIDFRVFVRELANVFRTRIELHQTTGRDEARRMGGFGMCGLPYCCGNFLKHFNQVTIKMARDQNLVGNLAKISGPCGRLLCCLNFEEDFYMEEGKLLPVPGTCVEYEGIKMFVLKTDPLNKKILLSDDDENITEVDLDTFLTLKILSSPDLELC